MVLKDPVPFVWDQLGFKCHLSFLKVVITRFFDILKSNGFTFTAIGWTSNLPKGMNPNLNLNRLFLWLKVLFLSISGVVSLLLAYVIPTFTNSIRVGFC